MKKNAALLFVLLVLASRPAFAADKQHLQMMAEIRLLQEQQQQLQQLIGGLQETLKSLNTKLDDQTAANRKAMADQTLAVNNINDNVRVLREKTDETNVRISSVSQELEGLRQSIAAQPPPQGIPSAPPQSSGGAPSGFPPNNLVNPAAGSPTPSAPGIQPGASAQRMFETSYDDYTAGRWDLAIQGFQNFIAEFPKAPQAGDAQFNIGMSYYSQSKYPEARDAFTRVTTDFPQSQGTTVPDAYYKLGQTYEHLNQIDAAKQAYQTVVQRFPGTTSATLANGSLQRLNHK
jgi:tol-pal system protein YbgF